VKLDPPEDPLEGPDCRDAIRTMRDTLPIFERDRPDLIIYDYGALAGKVIAHKLDIPTIFTGPAFARCPDNLESQVPDPVLRGIIADACQAGDQFLSRYGILDANCMVFREKLTIYPFPKAFQPLGDVFDESRLYAGRFPGEQPYYGNWQKGDFGGRRVVLVSTSTTYKQGPEFFRACIEALSALKCHVLLSIGDHGDPTALQPLPDHFEIVQHNSHVKLLPHVDAFICCAGIITASEAAYHGVPLIAMSLGIVENVWEADIFERLGIAIHLRGDAALNRDALTSATIRALEDRSMLDRVREMQQKVQREPGAEEAANRVEEFLVKFCARR
jgi:MGT family glycosyltransferase